MKPNLIDFKQTAKRALGVSKSLVPTILPHGFQQGCEWVSINPNRKDQSQGSFKVNLSTGKWADFATNDRGGDFISLIAYLDNCTQHQAAKKILKIIGEFR
jgi:putative DNA primase/helicase